MKYFWLFSCILIKEIIFIIGLSVIYLLLEQVLMHGHEISESMNTICTKIKYL